MVDHSLSESVWRRGWEDTKRGWTNWRFVVADMVILPLLAVVVSVPVALVGALLSLSGMWIGATALAPIRQRNEARLAREAAAAKSDAPDLQEHVEMVKELEVRFTGPVICDGRLCRGISQAWLFNRATSSLAIDVDSRYISALSRNPDLDDTVNWIDLFGQWNIDGLVGRSRNPGPSMASTFAELGSDSWNLTPKGGMVAKMLQRKRPADPQFFP